MLAWLIGMQKVDKLSTLTSLRGFMIAPAAEQGLL